MAFLDDVVGLPELWALIKAQDSNVTSALTNLINANTTLINKIPNIEVGSYKGTGGTSQTLTFSKSLQYGVIVLGGSSDINAAHAAFSINATSAGVGLKSEGNSLTVAWANSNKTLTFSYSAESYPERRLMSSSSTYLYIAF